MASGTILPSAKPLSSPSLEACLAVCQGPETLNLCTEAAGLCSSGFSPTAFSSLAGSRASLSAVSSPLPPLLFSEESRWHTEGPVGREAQ